MKAAKKFAAVLLLRMGQVAPVAAAPHLNVAVVQTAPAPTLAESTDRIVLGLRAAAARGARVAVFPEAMLRGQGSDRPEAARAALATIRRAAVEQQIYVVFGGLTVEAPTTAPVNWARVIAPDGRDLFYYEKLYDRHRGRMPGVFAIDGVPCSAMVCADRWLRGVAEIPIQQGAKVVFELADNFASEWVAPFGWYWNAPEALRNNVWVVFANTGQDAAPAGRFHGHSAIIAPDGSLAAASHDARAALVQTALDIARADRAEALARSGSPALNQFWQVGTDLQRGGRIDAPALTTLESSETNLTLAAAQTADRIDEMVRLIDEARRRGADLVALPAGAVSENELPRLQAAARANGLTVVAGAEHRTAEGRFDSAFVIGPDGGVLTRYDGVAAGAPFCRGRDAHTMWFEVKGVPAVVTVGGDGLWSELSELAAIAGAQLHVHLDRAPAAGLAARLRQLQIGANLASYQTFTVVANTVGSTIWDDLRSTEEIRAAVRGLAPPDTGQVEVYSPFSANLVVQATAPNQLIVATRRIPRVNRYHPGRTSDMNPQMDAWYRFGANLLRGGFELRPPASPEAQTR